MSKHIQPGNGDGPDCEPRKLRMIVRSSIQGSQTNVFEKHYGIESTKKKIVLGLSANPESMFKKNFEKRKWGKKQQQLGLAVAAVADEYPQKQRSRSNTTRVKVEQFRIELSTCEIEDDFINITGHPPSRKPIKRPNVVQNRLNTLFPGTSLTRVTDYSYMVHEFPEPHWKKTKLKKIKKNI